MKKLENLTLNEIKGLRVEDLHDFEELAGNDLVARIDRGDYAALDTVPAKNKADSKFMLPLIYAARNSNKTYVVYNYVDETAAKDGAFVDVAMDILEAEPQILEGKPIMSDPNFIRKCVEKDQANASKFNIPAELMAEILGKDIEGDDNLRKACIENPELIDTILEDIDSVDLGTLLVVHEAASFLAEKMGEKVLLESVANPNSTYKQFGKILEYVNKPENEGMKLRVMAGGVAKADVVNEETAIVYLRKAISAMGVIKKDLDKNGKIKVTEEYWQSIFSAKILKEILQKSGVQLTQEQEKLLRQYEAFYRSYEQMYQTKKHGEPNKAAEALKKEQAKIEAEADPQKKAQKREELIQRIRRGEFNTTKGEEPQRGAKSTQALGEEVKAELEKPAELERVEAAMDRQTKENTLEGRNDEGR